MSLSNSKKKWQIHNLDELDQVASEIIGLAEGINKFVFFGEIGAGKTTLIKSIGKRLGVVEQMSSPTFSIVNEYQGTVNLIRHLDLYRLKNIDEAIDINIEEYLDDNEYCFIEWPELIEPLFPDKMLYIRIQVNDDSLRTISVEKHG